jgi:hypothetical protein
MTDETSDDSELTEEAEPGVETAGHSTELISILGDVYRSRVRLLQQNLLASASIGQNGWNTRTGGACSVESIGGRR